MKNNEKTKIATIAERVSEIASEDRVFIHDPFYPSTIEVESASMNGPFLQINLPETSERRQDFFNRHWALQKMLNVANEYLDAIDFELVNEIFKRDIEMYAMEKGNMVNDWKLIVNKNNVK